MCVGGWVSPCAVSPLVVFPPRGVRGLCPPAVFRPARSFAFMAPPVEPSGVGTPDSGWQQTGRRGRAAAARISTTSAETLAGTQASPRHLMIVGVEIDTLCRSPPTPPTFRRATFSNPCRSNRPSTARRHYLSAAPPQLPAAPAPAAASATRALHTAARDPCATLRRPPLSSAHATARAPAHAHAPRADTTCLLPHRSAPQLLH